MTTPSATTVISAPPPMTCGILSPRTNRATSARHYVIAGKTIGIINNIFKGDFFTFSKLFGRFLNFHGFFVLFHGFEEWLLHSAFFFPIFAFCPFSAFFTIFGFLLNEFGKETCVWWLGGELGGSKHTGGKRKWNWTEVNTREGNRNEIGKHTGGKRKWNWTEVNKHQAEVHSLGPRTTPGTLYEVSHTHFTAPWDAIWGLTHTFYCRHFGRIIPLYTTHGCSIPMGNNAVVTSNVKERPEFIRSLKLCQNESQSQRVGV